MEPFETESAVAEIVWKLLSADANQVTCCILWIASVANMD